MVVSPVRAWPEILCVNPCGNSKHSLGVIERLEDSFVALGNGDNPVKPLAYNTLVSFHFLPLEPPENFTDRILGNLIVSARNDRFHIMLE